MSRHERRDKRIRAGSRTHRLSRGTLDKEGKNFATSGNYSGKGRNWSAGIGARWEAEQRGFKASGSGSAWFYRYRVRQAWEVELELVEDPRTRRALAKRLASFMRCGQAVKVRRCTKCKKDRQGSGTFEGTHTCKCRACPTCGSIRSRRVGAFMGEAFEKLKGPESGDRESVTNWRWQSIVVTIRYDPEDIDGDLSAAGLRSRAFLARKVAKQAWERVLKRRGAGMMRSIEVSQRGHVHLNLLYFGPAVDPDELDLVMTADDCRVGYCHVKKLDCDPTARKEDRVPVEDPRGSRKAVKKAAEYVSKGLEASKGAFSEDWLAGESAIRVVDPILAARWEIATYRLQLLQRYGALRKIELLEHGKDGETDHEDDSRVKCPHCGAVGAWKTAVRRTEEWLAECHLRGSPGLARSSWKPPPYTGPDFYR